MENDIVKRFFIGTGASYDRVVNIFTYGADRYWKRKMLAYMSPDCRTALDLACGTGIVTFRLAARLPEARIVGVDVTEEYLSQAQAKRRTRGRGGIYFVRARAEEVALKWEFDCIVSSYIPKYVPAEVLLANILPNLKPGGTLILHDFAYPENWLLRRLWHAHMRLMRAVGLRLFPEWQTVFNELESFVESTRWIEDYLAALERSGMEEVRLSRHTAGSAAIVVAKKPEDPGAD